MTDKNEAQAPQPTDILGQDESQEKEEKELESALSAGAGNTLDDDADKLDTLAEVKEENLKAWEEKLGKKLGQSESETQTQSQSR